MHIIINNVVSTCEECCVNQRDPFPLYITVASADNAAHQQY